MLKKTHPESIKNSHEKWAGRLEDVLNLFLRPGVFFGLFSGADLAVGFREGMMIYPRYH